MAVLVEAIRPHHGEQAEEEKNEAIDRAEGGDGNDEESFASRSQSRVSTPVSQSSVSSFPSDRSGSMKRQKIGTDIGNAADSLGSSLSNAMTGYLEMQREEMRLARDQMTLMHQQTLAQQQQALAQQQQA